MDHNEFREWAQKAADWGATYRESISKFPVRSQVRLGELENKLPRTAPETPESMGEIFADFERLIMPGITHWQHPRFFAYFPSNASPPSVVAEMLVASISAQCMIWQTSPAASELETVMLRWLAQALAIPEEFSGVIQDTASTATLVAILVMRERALNWSGNREGLSGSRRLRVYASDLVHSSIDRAVWIAGIGEENLVRIPTRGPKCSLDATELKAAIDRDLDAGLLPCGVVLCVGGTSFGATDDLAQACEVAQQYNLYTHVDAAWAGTAMLCPEFREDWRGIEMADSIVVNPHKWMGIQFDCSTHFFKNADAVLRTLAIHPEYLQTPDRGSAIDYCEYSIQLGRRFRALKMWFVMRCYGLEALRQRIRNHVAWAQSLASRLDALPGIEVVTQPYLSLFTFRLNKPGLADKALDDLNLQLLNGLNSEGQVYLSPTKVKKRQVLRFQIGQFDCTEGDVEIAYRAIVDWSRRLLS
ncbi:MAG: pyridoxal-dependent decarboxylase [Pirellulaceae bacterium]